MKFWEVEHMRYSWGKKRRLSYPLGSKYVTSDCEKPIVYREPRHLFKYLHLDRVDEDKTHKRGLVGASENKDYGYGSSRNEGW